MSWKQLENSPVFQDLRERLEEEEGNTASLHGQRRQLEGELTELKRDLESLESTLARTEKEKQVEGKTTRLEIWRYSLLHYILSVSGDIWINGQETRKLDVRFRPLNCVQWCVQGLDFKVRTLTGDLSQRDDHIGKLQKEKRALEELQQVDKHVHKRIYT